jgi:hypothetical protein
MDVPVPEFGCGWVGEKLADALNGFIYYLKGRV